MHVHRALHELESLFTVQEGNTIKRVWKDKVGNTTTLDILPYMPGTPWEMTAAEQTIKDTEGARRARNPPR